MKAPFPFEAVMVFSFLSIMLLTGIILRARVGVLQKFLFPGSLIGGLVGLILVNIHAVKLNPETIQAFAYHFFNISFISIGLTPPLLRGAGREVARGSLWMALVQGVTFPLQTVVGGLVVLLIGSGIHPSFGFLTALGFNEGPGEALSFGKVWESFGFQGAASVGLSYATIGFLFAFFVGVPLVNWGIRKGLGRSVSPDDEFLKGFYDRSKERSCIGEKTMHPANVDTLAFQLALVGLVYALTYGFIKLLAPHLPPDYAKMAWGFFFIVGMAFAYVVRKLISMIGFEYLINSGVQRRITGTAVDYLIVATGAGIQVSILASHVIPLLTISILAGVLTTFFVVFFGRRLPSYNLERIAAIYGTVTGTVSSGLLLLRIVDPEFQTPVAKEIGIMNIFVVPIIGTLTILINGPFWWKWSTLFTTLIFAAIGTVFFLVIKVVGLYGEKKF